MNTSLNSDIGPNVEQGVGVADVVRVLNGSFRRCGMSPNVYNFGVPF